MGAPGDLLVFVRTARAISVMALFTVIAAFLGIIIEIAVRLIAPEFVPPGLTTVIVLTLFLSAVQLLSLAIIGSYLAHIHDEVKRRPPYLIDNIINPPRRREDPPK